MQQATVNSAENVVFDYAERFILHTSRAVFLTGKAGTGKTTFLKHIRQRVKKNTVVVAPTGVAAINAGGVTIHSFFQLPFTPFLPVVNPGLEAADDLSDRYSLLKNLKIDAEKRRLFRELELLIIDEVSMVRCDVLDAMDTILRHFRAKRHVPFGGVQVLFIGDLFQLPPVVSDDQWGLLSRYYEGPFFFHASVVKTARPLYLELKKIYRQSDRHFIGILNHIRNNEVDEADLAVLNERYLPDFKPPSGKGYVTLTTHNYVADALNAEALKNLPGDLHCFEGVVEGDFSERSLPTDKVLTLKEGAQVMFIKNDSERIRRYYNGKIGIIKRIEAGNIVVCFEGEENELVVEKETWKNVRYSFNAQTRQVEEEILGTFTQYAIRLAWAITIHKSQGLTFDHVIIDAGKSFAPGQVYVALSRCTTLAGIVLYSKISKRAISTDERVIRFAQEETSIEDLSSVLVREQMQHHVSTLGDIFDWDKTIEVLDLFAAELQDRKFADRDEAAVLILALLEKARQHHGVALKFQRQLHQLAVAGDYDFLHTRVVAAVSYFTNIINEGMCTPLHDHLVVMMSKKRVKKYLKTLRALIAYFEGLKAMLERAPGIALHLKNSL